MKTSPACCTLALLLVASPALAHAMLESALPRVGSTVAASPPTVTLNFSVGLEPRFSSIQVTAANGARMDKNDLHTAAGNPKQVAVDLLPLPPGPYGVVWHALSIDGHKTQGRFTFFVAK
jgi:methionine-rich copper-binding protein CopC